MDKHNGHYTPALGEKDRVMTVYGANCCHEGMKKKKNHTSHS